MEEKYEGQMENININQYEFISSMNGFSCDSSYFISLKTNSKTALFLNPIDLSISQRELNLPFDLAGTLMTLIPHNKIFCYGNLPISGLSFTVDESFDFKILCESAPLFGAGGIYLDEKIYVFGGCNYTNLLGLSQMYDLNKNK